MSNTGFKYRTALTDEQIAKANEWFSRSIQYGEHTDDNGKNEGHGYVIAQVAECRYELALPETEPIIITLTALLMKQLLSGHYAYTLDLPFSYD